MQWFTLLNMSLLTSLRVNNLYYKSMRPLYWIFDVLLYNILFILYKTHLLSFVERWSPIYNNNNYLNNNKLSYKLCDIFKWIWFTFIFKYLKEKFI